MKIRHKKTILSVTAAAIAGVLGVGAFLQSTQVAVQASSVVMPGIEKIVKKSSQGEPFRILEIVDNSTDAEIGYYVSGQEPFLKLFQYTYTYTPEGSDSPITVTLTYDSIKQELKNESGTQPTTTAIIERFLSKIPSVTDRAAFMKNLAEDSSGQRLFRDVTDVSADGSSEDITQDLIAEKYPLAYKEYVEKFFLDETDNSAEWNKVALENSSKETLSGHFAENSEGTGEYTRSKTYYSSVSQQTDAEGNSAQGYSEDGKYYRENIESFSLSSTATAPYMLVFEEVNNDAVNGSIKEKGTGVDGSEYSNADITSEYDYSNGKFGYYTNVYTNLTETIVQNIENKNYQFPGENWTHDENDQQGILLVDNGVNAQSAFTADDGISFSSDPVNSSLADGDGTSGEAADNNQAEVIEEPSVVQTQAPQSQNADSFSSDAAFSSGFESSAEDLVDVEADSASNEGIDTGAVGADAFSSTPSDNTNSGNKSMVGADGGNSAAESTTVETTEETTANRYDINKIDNTGTAGTQENPYIYRVVEISSYPYYKYEFVGDFAYVLRNAYVLADYEKKAEERNEKFTPEIGDISVSADGNYQVCVQVSEDLEADWEALSIVTGKQLVPAEDVLEKTNLIDESLGYNYYYRVKQVYFYGEDKDITNDEQSKGTGWYNVKLADLDPEKRFVEWKQEDNSAYVAYSHYISNAEYSLTPETGKYDFVPGNTEGKDKEHTFEVNHIYYQGGYSNNDWLKRYVFHLTPDDDDVVQADETSGFDSFQIDVTTLSVSQFDSLYGESLNPDAVYDSGQVFSSREGTQALGDGSEADGSAPLGDGSGEASVENSTVEALPTTSAETSLVDISGDSSQISDGTADAEAVGASADLAETQTADSAEAFSDDTLTDVEETTDAGIVSDEVSDVSVSDSEELITDAVAEASDEENSAAGTISSITSLLAENLPEKTRSRSLSDYDLIYVNGKLSSNGMFNVLNTPNSSNSRIPVIINQAKVGSGSDMETVLKENNLLNDKDANRHYVNGRIYFFRNIENTDDSSHAEGADSSFLVNLAFHSNFNPNESSEDTSGFGDNDARQGFEEILEYVSLENKYRQLDKKDGEDVETLTAELSQARAIEYILNYQYKRNIKVKDAINVLEIEPAKSDGKLTQETVLKWMGYDKVTFTVKACCEQGETGEGTKGSASYANDRNEKTAWYSNSGNGTKTHESTEYGGAHYLTITNIPDNMEVSGIFYTPCQVKDSDGCAKTISVYVYDAKGEQIGNISDYTISDSRTLDIKKLSFGQTYPGYGIGKIDVVITSAYDKDGNVVTPGGDGYCANCSEIGLIRSDAPKINVTVMTAAEYAGRNDDVNTDYDFIYIGDDDSIRNDVQPRVQAQANLLMGNSTMLYSHVGAVGVAGVSDGIKITGIDYARGSGNDMTEQQYNALMEFVQSGYPVVLADRLLKTEGSAKTVNTEYVDNSSWYYQFLNKTLNTDSVLTESEIEEGQSAFYLNLAKPVITLLETPPDILEGDYLTGDGLTYQFEISNDSEIMKASESYDCHLYLDLNCDGRFSEGEDQNIVIKENGNTVEKNAEGKYELKAGQEHQYTLTREKIGAAYYKVIEWKLEITSNSNANVRTSEIGYTKRSRGDEAKQVIRVLQVEPDNSKNGGGRGTWDLTSDSELSGYLSAIEDFEIQITSVTMSTFESDPNSFLNGGSNDQKSKQILILGFDDMYQSISENAAEEILKFIEDGKSVIFSHDTTSQNSSLRSVAGMDRYGISNSESIQDSLSISDLLKKGKTLTDKGSVDGVAIDFATLVQKAGDVAYTSNENRSTSYAETQGYSNGRLVSREKDAQTTSVTKVNSGVITEYPYQIPDSMEVSQTHSQNYQLALEKQTNGVNDITVWFCLSGSNSSAGEENSSYEYYTSSNDVRNNYYFYSKGNVFYMGAGHSTGVTTDEKKLLVNTIVAAANAAVIDPEVNFVNKLDPKAQIETVRYFMADLASMNASDEDPTTDSLLEKDMTFYINILDYNMSNTDINGNSPKNEGMTVEFYIQDDENGNYYNSSGEVTEDSKKAVCDVKLKNLTENISSLTSFTVFDANASVEESQKIAPVNGVYTISTNDVYSMTLSNVENYLKSKTSGKLVVKITSNLDVNGTASSRIAWSSIDLKQRLLFDLD